MHTATGAYVLHALPPAERALFEEHMALCEPCEVEVRELTETAARLGTALAARPAPELKAEVLRRIDAVRQEPPRVDGDRAPEARGRLRVRRPPGAVRGAGRWALAACLAAAAGLGGIAVWQQQEAESARSAARRAEQSAAAVTAVLAAPDAQAASGRLSGGATGTVVVSRERDRAVFVAAGLPELPEGRVYQLWFADGDGREEMRPAGLLNGGGSGAVLMEGRVANASGMGVTVEPAGGSERPTTKPIAAMELPV
ncbi:anti-sigma factor domain-containing protein [Streptomyces sp. NPDC004134]|uniref:anti-sigma factor n=1 Tax=Streptomyces sp. NPDC004134 TaxID=3364691 RepID=UPI0036946BCB